MSVPSDAAALRAELVVEYAYTRSTGPIVGAFLQGLADRRILGTRGAGGRVLVPAVEYDPVTAEECTELVEVGQAGTVASWSWQAEPGEGQPLDRPFAWALVRLDGADTALLHAVDAGSPAAMATGMRVRARWAEERRGFITDLWFQPEDA